jgi:hypothetical protein
VGARKRRGFSITFDTAQDVDAIAARIKSSGWTLAMEPADMPGGFACSVFSIRMAIGWASGDP